MEASGEGTESVRIELARNDHPSTAPRNVHLHLIASYLVSSHYCTSLVTRLTSHLWATPSSPSLASHLARHLHLHSPLASQCSHNRTRVRLPQEETSDNALRGVRRLSSDIYVYITRGWLMDGGPPVPEDFNIRSTITSVDDPS